MRAGMKNRNHQIGAYGTEQNKFDIAEIEALHV